MSSPIQSFQPLNLQASPFGHSSVNSTSGASAAAEGNTATSATTAVSPPKQTTEISSTQNPSGVSDAYAQASKAYAMMNIQQA